MMGVDYELFWTLNPKSLSPFVKAFELKQKYHDFMEWNMGNYILEAIGAVFAKSGGKYPNKPHFETRKDATMTPEEIKERVRIRAIAINSRFGKE